MTKITSPMGKKFEMRIGPLVIMLTTDKSGISEKHFALEVLHYVDGQVASHACADSGLAVDTSPAGSGVYLSAATQEAFDFFRQNRGIEGCAEHVARAGLQAFSAWAAR